MTPKERANADAIQASIEAVITGRKKKTPGVSRAEAEERETNTAYLKAALIVIGITSLAVTWFILPTAPHAEPYPLPLPAAAPQPASDDLTRQLALRTQAAIAASNSQPTPLIRRIPSPPPTTAPAAQPRPQIEYNVYRDTRPARASQGVQQTEMDEDDKAHAKAGQRWAFDHAYKEIRAANNRPPIPNTLSASVTSSKPEGGWGKHTVQGTLEFQYYDMSGTRITATKEYTVHTEPAKNGEIRATGLTIR